MKLSIQKNCSHTILLVNKDNLDARIAPELKSELVAIVGKGEKNILIDLSNCSHCDSSGLSALLLGNRLCLELNGRLVLCGLTDQIRKSIDLLGFEVFLNIAESREAAAALFEC